MKNIYDGHGNMTHVPKVTELKVFPKCKITKDKYGMYLVLSNIHNRQNATSINIDVEMLKEINRVITLKLKELELEQK